jgi:dTDP-4-dehydrorhamnose reductase
MAVDRQTLDITDIAQIAAVLEQRRPDLVINAAAYTAVDSAEREPEAAYRLNGAGAANLARYCEAAGIPLIHMSTDMVFQTGDPDRLIQESDWAAPVSVYGSSKLEGENLVRASGARSVIARVSWLFSGDKPGFVAKILDAGRTRDALNVVTDEIGRPTPMHALADQLIKLANQLAEGGPLPPVLHLGPSGPVSRMEWAEAIFETAKAAGGPSPALHPVTSDAFDTPAKRPVGVVLDTTLANSLLGPMPGWRPASDEIVRELLANQPSAAS